MRNSKQRYFALIVFGSSLFGFSLFSKICLAEPPKTPLQIAVIDDNSLSKDNVYKNIGPVVNVSLEHPNGSVLLFQTASSFTGMGTGCRINFHFGPAPVAESVRAAALFKEELEVTSAHYQIRMPNGNCDDALTSYVIQIKNLDTGKVMEFGEFMSIATANHNRREELATGKYALDLFNEIKDWKNGYGTYGTPVTASNATSKVLQLIESQFEPAGGSGKKMIASPAN